MTLLILAGSGEAKTLVRAVAAAGVDAVASLAGATRTPAKLDVPTRTGGFGGEDGFRGYLQSANVKAVVDATHPFAHRITDRTARVCRDLALPYLQVLRPQWEPEDGDTWTFIDREEEAAPFVRPGQTVFLGTGRQTLHRFANLTDCRIICRQIDPPTGPFPFPNGQFLVGRPPFPVAEEEALFKDLSVDWLIVKNAGGAPSRTKLIAARRLGIPVLMINRPPMPDADRVQTVEAALDWIARR